MSRPDEGLIHAWLDGELDAEEAARVARLVAEDAEWGAAAAEARGLIAASSRILGHLDVVAGDVIPQGGSAAPAFARKPEKPAFTAAMPGGVAARSRRAVPQWLRVAAGFVLVAGVAYLGRDAFGTGETRMMGAAADRMMEPADASAPVAATEGVPAGAVVETDRARGAGVGETDAAFGRRDVDASPAVEPLASSAQDAPERANAVVGAVSGVAAPVTAPSREVAAAKAVVTDSIANVRGDVPMRDRARVAETAAAQAAPAAAVAPAVAAAPAAKSAANEEARIAEVRQAVVPSERREVESRVARQASAAGAASVQSLGASNDAAPAAMRAAAEPMASTLDRRRAPALAGCWRVVTRAPVDSLQRDPQVLRSAGDTLVIALTPGSVEARVVRRGTDGLVGQVPGAAGASLTATLVRCPR